MYKMKFIKQAINQSIIHHTNAVQVQYSTVPYYIGVIQYCTSIYNNNPLPYTVRGTTHSSYCNSSSSQNRKSDYSRDCKLTTTTKENDDK
jgi:hypothetical protein